MPVAVTSDPRTRPVLLRAVSENDGGAIACYGVVRDVVGGARGAARVCRSLRSLPRRVARWRRGRHCESHPFSERSRQKQSTVVGQNVPNRGGELMRGFDRWRCQLRSVIGQVQRDAAVVRAQAIIAAPDDLAGHA